MGEGIIGLVAVTMFFRRADRRDGTTYYRGPKVADGRKAGSDRTRSRRSDGSRNSRRPARSRRSGILLVAGAVGYMITSGWIRTPHGTRCVDRSGVWRIPLALGLGFFLDSALVRRDLHA